MLKIVLAPNKVHVLPWTGKNPNIKVFENILVILAHLVYNGG